MKTKFAFLLCLVLLLCTMTGHALADSVMLPESLETIEAEAFYGDTSVTEVILPDGVSAIGERAFAYSGLQRITVPDTVTQIAEDAFDGLEGLTIVSSANAPAREYAVLRPQFTWEEQIRIDETNFPDAAFRTVAADCDTDGNGWLSRTETTEIRSLNLGDRSISSLQGIEHFTELKELFCQNNQGIDLSAVSGMPLEVLVLNDCQLTNLDVITSLPELRELRIPGNNVSALDISNNPALAILECHGNEALTALDLGSNPMLQMLVKSTSPTTESYGDSGQKLVYMTDDCYLSINAGIELNMLCAVSCDANHGYFQDDQGDYRFEHANLGTEYTPAYLPVRDGYAFRGWNITDHWGNTVRVLNAGESFVITGDTWLYAIWEPVGETVTIIYEPNGGEFGDGTTDPKTDTAAVGYEYYPDHNIHKEGYILNGWTDGNGIYGNTIDSARPVPLIPEAGEPITLTPVWLRMYTVTFDPNGGTIMGGNSVTYYPEGSVLSYPYVERDGFTIIGWMLEGERAPDVYHVNGDVTLVAEWVENENVTGIPINQDNFYSPQFRSFVRTYDTDNDGFLSPEETDRVSSMDCSGQGITSLQGLSHFSSLTSLNCSNNNLYDIYDVSYLPALSYLDCHACNLYSLWMDNFSGLTYLDCSNNNLTELEIGGNTNLATLICDHNSLSYLNLVNCRTLADAVSNGEERTTETVKSYWVDNALAVQTDLALPIACELEDLATGVTISDEELILFVGESHQLTAIVEPETAIDKTVYWTSYDESIATVSADGTVNARSTGETTVSCTTVNGYYAECRVIVESGELEILTQPENVSGEVGDIATLHVAAGGRGLTYLWQYRYAGYDWLNNWQDIGVDEETALSATLSFTITEAMNGTEFRCLIDDEEGNRVITDAVTCMVVIRPREIVLDHSSIRLKPGEDIVLEASILPEGAISSLSWLVSDESIATVTEDGHITGITEGETTLTVTASNGVSASCQVYVTYDIVQDDVIYREIDESSLYVYAYRGSASELTIPESVDGRTVAEIGENAFENNTTLQSIVIPDTIIFIRESAFAGTSLSIMNNTGGR